MDVFYEAEQEWLDSDDFWSDYVDFIRVLRPGKGGKSEETK